MKEVLIAALCTRLSVNMSVDISLIEITQCVSRLIGIRKSSRNTNTHLFVVELYSNNER